MAVKAEDALAVAKVLPGWAREMRAMRASSEGVV